MNCRPPAAPSTLNPGGAGDLDEITLRLLLEDPDGRYQSARQLVLALETVKLLPIG